MADVRTHLTRVARIARWEVSRGVGAIDRRTAALGVVALLLAGVVAGAGVAQGPAGVAVDRNIYRVGVAPESPYYGAVTASTPLAPRSPSPTAFREGRRSLLIPAEIASRRGVATGVVVDPDDVTRRQIRDLLESGRIIVAETRKGRAALSALRSAVRQANDRRMATESNQTAAFPVIVTLRYVSREEIQTGTTPTPASGEQTPTGTSTPTPTSTPAPGGSGTGDRGPGGFFGGGGPLQVPGFGAGGVLATGETGSPAEIDPPFPFGSLVLAFAFLIPMNFVIQAYGSTILNERINRRGELLLVSPVTPGDIIAGKTLPYLATMIGVTVGIAAAIGGGAVSVAAVVPIALLFLAATFVGGMFARSFKELTFVTVAISVFLTTYTFVPAIFTEVTPIALISPLTLVVRDLRAVGITSLQYAFSTGPFYFASAVLFLLGAGIYREEDMFTQRPVPLKLLDALDSRLRGKLSVGVMSALAIPFVFIAELLVVAFLFPVSQSVPTELLLVPLMVSIAAVEEVAKSAHVYAGFAKARFERTWRTALVLGSLSGLGFFLGEKVTVVVQLIGLTSSDIPLGRAAFAPSGIGIEGAIGLLLAPLVLHAVTASVSALGASRDRVWYGAAVATATLIHTLYNLTVVMTLG